MELKVFDLGLVDFKQACDFQKEVFRQVKSGALESGLILCRHYPAITLGRTASLENILCPGQELAIRNIRLYQIERGGNVTYHGPGQLMAYPIFNLGCLKKDIHLFLRQLEDVALRLFSEFRIEALRLEGSTGVWVGRQKIASIGIAVRNWITSHGLSINIKKDDLANFRLIRPCGMDIEMTSMETVARQNMSISLIKERLIYKFKDVFSIKTDNIS